MAVSLGTNIANPISTALSQRPGFDTMGKLANYGKLGVTDPDAVIEALFANNEQGLWYDYSDLSTMFQDRAGTTLVTSDGQPVGLILDKSKGLVLGPELVTNGDFASGTTGWTVSPGKATQSVVAGELEIVSIAEDNQYSSQTVAVQNGKWYEVTGTMRADAANTVANSCRFDISFGGAVTRALVSGNGNQKTFRFVLLSTFTQLYLSPSVASSAAWGAVGDKAYFDNISVKELPGNHAVAPNDAARPLYKTSGGLHWLQFDGVNNCLSTSAINFTSTAKMGVFVGAELVASASSTFLIEFSANGLGNAGAFYLKTTDSGSNYLQVATNTTDYLYGNSAVISRPVTKVIAQLIDFSITPDQPANQLKLRVNASPETLSLTGYMPTGSFGTYPLYVASRANADYYFGGKLYSMIVRGALSDTQQITDTETWVNGKTNAY